MKVGLDFTVSESGLPALITVRSMGGELIWYGKVYRRRNRLCFCSKSRNLIITVRPFNDDFYEKSYFIKFGQRICYDIRLDFDFTAKNEKESLQTFYLYDGNYRFLVAQAELTFSAVY